MSRIASLLSLIGVFLLAACGRNSRSGPFDYDLIPVATDEKYGYIDHSGKYVINPQFEKAFPFSEGLAVTGNDRKFGYVDKTGKLVIPMEFLHATFFSDGIALVVREDQYPVGIDKNGKELFQLAAVESARAFCEGRAAVMQDDKWGFIDKTGKIVITPQFESVGDFHEGRAAFRMKSTGKNLFGYIDTEGKIVINPQFDSALEFAEGRAAVELGNKWGFIDAEGKYLVNPQFDRAWSFTEGLARIRQGDNIGFVDTKGSISINPQFTMAGPFSGGLALVYAERRKAGFIDPKGKFVINPQFEVAGDFIQGLAAVVMADRVGFIDEAGKFVVNPQFHDVTLMNEDYRTSAVIYGVESEYFDFGNVFENIMMDTDKETFMGVNTQTTLRELADTKYPDQLEVDGFSRVKSNRRISLGDLADMVQLTFMFPEGVRNYDFWQGTSYNFDLNVDGLSFRMDLKGKAEGQVQKFIRKAGRLIQSRAGGNLTESGESVMIDGDGYQVTISRDYGSYSKGISIEVRFNDALGT